MGTASLVLGIISVVTGWTCCGVLPGLISFVLGLVSFIKNKDKKGLVGMILSFIGSGAGFVIVILSLSGLTTPMSLFMPSSNSGTITPSTTVSSTPSTYESPSFEEPSDDFDYVPESDYEIDWDSIWSTGDSEKEVSSEEQKKETVSDEKETTVEKESEEENSEKEEESEKKELNQNEIRPEIKDAIDSYETFMDEYIDFMNKYNTSNSTELLMEYMDWLSKYADMAEKMEKMEGDLTEAETKYYTEVMARISGKMIQFSLTQ